MREGDGDEVKQASWRDQRVGWMNHLPHSCDTHLMG